MKRITAIILLVLSITIPVIAFNVIASDDPLYDYWQDQQRQQMHHREKVVHIITIDSNNGTVRIQCGDDIQLELPENNTTGYSWHFDELNYEIVSERQERKSDRRFSCYTYLDIKTKIPCPGRYKDELLQNMGRKASRYSIFRS